MSAERGHSAEFERCGSCQGIWVERYSLAVALGDPGKAREFDWTGLSAELDDGQETGFRCTTCDQLFIARRTMNVELDVCRGCGGIFLDHSELEALRDAARREARRDRLENVAGGSGELGGEVANQMATNSVLHLVGRALASLLS